LPKLYYCHDGSVKKQVKKTNQKNPIKMIEVKMTCPKWHFGQIGQGARKLYGGFFLPKFK